MPKSSIFLYTSSSRLLTGFRKGMFSSMGEEPTSLLKSSLDDISTCTRLHSGQESESSLSFESVWLVSVTSSTTSGTKSLLHEKSRDGEHAWGGKSNAWGSHGSDNGEGRLYYCKHCFCVCVWVCAVLYYTVLCCTVLVPSQLW